MPRQARAKSNSGIYHIMTRGINKEQIFKTNIYKKTVIDIVKEIMTDIDFSIIAYCIMDNHLHLLLEINDDNLEILMKRLILNMQCIIIKLKKDMPCLIDNLAIVLEIKRG